MNTIRPQQTGEPPRDWRSPVATSDSLRWQYAFTIGGDAGVVGGSMSGKGVAVNVGDLSGQDVARHPAGVRAAIVVQASHRKTKAGKSGTVERSRVMIGGVKGGREVERQKP